MLRIGCVVLLGLFTGCYQGSFTMEKTASGDPQTERTDSSSEAAKENASGAATTEFIIDVRSKKEWDGGHVESAFHIPHTEIVNRIGEITGDKNAKIILYCAVGGRAGQAKKALEGAGFTSVENGGGYDDMKKRSK